MKKNIFEHACFGKAYKTRDGRKAIFHNRKLSRVLGKGITEVFYLICEKLDREICCFQDGKERSFVESEIDIVSEWEEGIEEQNMNRYTIYCTEAQTKKAFNLGAPIMQYKSAYISESVPHCVEYEGGTRIVTVFPTAEQMIGWLEEQGILCDVFPTGDYGNDGFGMRIMIKAKRLNRFESDAITYSSRKEATIAAIDAALEYLSRNKK